MADTMPHPGVGRSAPDLLTVAQAAQVLQLGRTTAYLLVNRFVATNGAEGIPVVVVGGQYRIPRVRLEELIGGPITWPPETKSRRRRRSAENVARTEVGREDVGRAAHADGDAAPLLAVRNSSTEATSSLPTTDSSEPAHSRSSVTSDAEVLHAGTSRALEAESNSACHDESDQLWSEQLLLFVD